MLEYILKPGWAYTYFTISCVISYTRLTLEIIQCLHKSYSGKRYLILKLRMKVPNASLRVPSTIKCYGNQLHQVHFVLRERETMTNVTNQDN
jgi:hypothetical protein